MKLIKNKKGFSFLEVMITIAVLSVGILGVLALVSSSMRYSMNARDSIIASELAQEGIELARNVRDNNFITHSSDPFYDFITSPPAWPGMNRYKIDYDDATLNYIGASCRLYYNASTGLYAHSWAGTTLTKFQRQIIVDPYGTSDRKITSMVSWGSSLSATCALCTYAKKCVCVEDILTAWK